MLKKNLLFYLGLFFLVIIGTFLLYKYINISSIGNKNIQDNKEVNHYIPQNSIGADF